MGQDSVVLTQCSVKLVETMGSKSKKQKNKKNHNNPHRKHAGSEQSEEKDKCEKVVPSCHGPSTMRKLS